AAAALAIGLALAFFPKSVKGALSLTPLLLFLLRGPIDAAADTMLGATAGSHFYVGELLYNVSCSVIFLCFVFSPDRFVRTPFFASFVAFLGVMVFVEPYFGAGELIFYLGSVLAARIVIRFAATNLDLFRRLGVVRTTALFARSLVFMAPILALIGMGEWLRASVESAMSDAVYAKAPLCASAARLEATEDLSRKRIVERTAIAAGLSGLSPPSCPPTLDDNERKAMLADARKKYVALRRDLRNGDTCAALRADAAGAPRHLERDLCYYAEYLHAGRAAAIKAHLLDTKGDAKLTADRLRQNARELSVQIVPFVRIPRPSSCPEFPWLPCELERTGLYLTEKGINGGLSRIRSGMIAIADDVADAGVALSDDAIDDLKGRVDDAVLQLKLATRATLSNGFDLAGVLDHALLVLLVLAFLKSLLFIFARVAFASVDKETTIGFTETDDVIPTGAIKVKGKRHALRGRGRIFYSRRAQVEGVAPRIALPQPAVCLFSRILSGTYFMNKADCEHAPEGRIVFKTAGVNQLVEWRLAENEEVLFRLDDFVAMDDGIRLSNYVSFRIPTLLMGRFIFRVARGPGRLLLRTPGTAEVDEKGDASLSKPVYRLAAWHRAAQFKLEAEHSFADIYLSAVHLKKSPGDLVVFVAEAGERKRVGTGAARFLKNFILPI
ncbi:MAG: hypothetical protein AAF942_06435, partial [Pseudomonadota bacterium]